MDRRVSVIINSTAGTGCPPEWIEALRDKFSAFKVQADIEVVERGADLLAVAKRAMKSGASAVVACGGDGTMSAVASCLAGSEVAMGVLPMGTLNHFAKDLNIPLGQDEAVANIATGRVLAVDVGEVNDRIFINNSSLGLYPDIVRERERRQRRLGYGKWRALFEASINAARRYPVLSVQIELEGKAYERRTPFVFVGNNRYTMEGFEIGERPLAHQRRVVAIRHAAQGPLRPSASGPACTVQTAGSGARLRRRLRAANSKSIPITACCRWLPTGRSLRCKRLCAIVCDLGHCGSSFRM